MNDLTIPAGLTRDEARAVREWAERARAARVQDETVAHAARVLLAVLPRPTMADMPEEERPACRWLQCDAGPAGRRGVITHAEDWHVYVVDKETGVHSNYSPDLVIPRPDLPRMTWPGDTPHTGPTVTFSMPAPTAPTPALPDGWLLADHETRGRVIVTRPEPDNDGEVVIVCPLPDRVTRAAIYWCNNDKLTYLDQEPHHDPR